MAQFTDQLGEEHISMIARQSVFFVATAAAEAPPVRATDRYIAGKQTAPADD